MYHIPEHLAKFPWYPSHLAWRGHSIDAPPERADLRDADLRDAGLRDAELSDD